MSIGMCSKCGEPLEYRREGWGPVGEGPRRDMQWWGCPKCDAKTPVAAPDAGDVEATRERIMQAATGGDESLRQYVSVVSTEPSDADDVENDLIPRMVIAFAKAAGPAWEADESGMEAGMRAVYHLLAAREAVLRGFVRSVAETEVQHKLDEFIPDDKEEAYALGYADALEDGTLRDLRERAIKLLANPSPAAKRLLAVVEAARLVADDPWSINVLVTAVRALDGTGEPSSREEQ